jgi:hypothetical protein
VAGAAKVGLDGRRWGVVRFGGGAGVELGGAGGVARFAGLPAFAGVSAPAGLRVGALAGAAGVTSDLSLKAGGGRRAPGMRGADAGSGAPAPLGGKNTGMPGPAFRGRC